jgi:hypothetical protein
MANDYINPFSAVDPAQFGGRDPQTGAINPWTSYFASQNASQAQPFIEMAQKGHELSLQKQQAETNEFTDPLAVAARRAKLESETATNNNTTALAPKKLEADRARLDAEIKLAGPEAELRVKKIGQEMDTIKGQPIAKSLAFLASLESQIRKAPEAARGIIYENQIAAFKQANPDAQIPRGFETWNDKTALNLMITHRAMIENVDYTQKKELEDRKITSNEKIHAGNNAASIRVAEINGDASVYRADSAVEGRQGQQVSRFAAAFIKATESLDKDYALLILQEPTADGKIKLMNDKEARKAKIRRDLMQEFGVTPGEVGGSDGATPAPSTRPPVPAGKVRVKDMDGRIGLIPKSDLEEAKKQGYTEVK